MSGGAPPAVKNPGVFCQTNAVGSTSKQTNTHSPQQFDGEVLQGITLRPSGKFQAQIHYDGRSRYIGVFDPKVEATSAYEMKHRKLKESNSSSTTTTNNTTVYDVDGDGDSVNVNGQGGGVSRDTTTTTTTAITNCDDKSRTTMRGPITTQQQLYRTTKERECIQLKKEAAEFARDERVRAIFECRKKGDMLAEIATTMSLDLSQVKNPYYSSKLPEVKAYIKEKKIEKGKVTAYEKEGYCGWWVNTNGARDYTTY